MTNQRRPSETPVTVILENIEGSSKLYYNDGKCLIARQQNKIVFLKRIYVQDSPTAIKEYWE